jgi:hypothetical protein
MPGNIGRRKVRMEMADAPNGDFARNPAGVARLGAIDEEHMYVEAAAFEPEDLVEDRLQPIRASIENVANRRVRGLAAVRGIVSE